MLFLLILSIAFEDFAGFNKFTLVAEPGYPGSRFDSPQAATSHSNDFTMTKQMTSTERDIFPERGVPTFDGALSRWKEYEKRALIFIAKLKLENKENEAALMLTSGLTGDAWDEVEDLSTDDIAKPDAAKNLVSRLRARFKMDDRTELADDFEEYFYKLKRHKG